MLWNSDLEAFIAWFVSPSTKDEVELKSTLWSVPDDSWGTVQARLSVIYHEMSRIVPLAPDPLPNKPIEAKHLTEEDLSNYDLAGKKERLLAEEKDRRYRQPR